MYIGTIHHTLTLFKWISFPARWPTQRRNKQWYSVIKKYGTHSVSGGPVDIKVLTLVSHVPNLGHLVTLIWDTPGCSFRSVTTARQWQKMPFKASHWLGKVQWKDICLSWVLLSQLITRQIRFMVERHRLQFHARIKCQKRTCGHYFPTT